MRKSNFFSMIKSYLSVKKENLPHKGYSDTTLSLDIAEGRRISIVCLDATYILLSSRSCASIPFIDGGFKVHRKRVMVEWPRLIVLVCQ